jgi:hypothetical protein
MLNYIINLANKFLAQPIFANDDTAGKIINPVIGDLGKDPEKAASGTLITDYAVRLWRIGISVGALVVLLYFIIAAYEWLTSGDDTKGVEKAKARFTNATIGLILLVASFVIIAFIGQLLFGEEFDILNLTFPTD